MEYFVYGRDNPNTATLREALAEAHWSFMDHYAAAMIARGPTLTADEAMATGSMHIVDLPDAAAAQVFAFEEPYYQAAFFVRCCCVAGAMSLDAPCGTSRETPSNIGAS